MRDRGGMAAALVLDQARLRLRRGERGRVRQGGERVLERAAGAGRGRARARLWRSWLRRPPPGANGLGRVEPGLLPQQQAEIVVGLGEAWLERDRAAGLASASSRRPAWCCAMPRLTWQTGSSGVSATARTSSAAAGSARPCIRSSTPSGARPGRGRAVRPAPHRPRVRPAPGGPPRQGPRRGRGARGARLRPARAGRGAAVASGTRFSQFHQDPCACRARTGG